MRSEILLVPLTDQREVILTIEPSVAFGEPTLILPGGVAEPDEAHEQTALRELQEEIGFTAARLDFLGEMRPLSKYFTLQTFIYLARELTPSKLEGDEDYSIHLQNLTEHHLLWVLVWLYAVDELPKHIHASDVVG
jgi:8-oxo-dGTP pyrophosphatase MutT (NUDIX family)